MRNILIFIALSIQLSLCTENWTIGSTLLSRADTQFALGYYNGTVKLYGAQGYNKQYMSFDVSTEIFTDHGTDYLSSFLNGEGQFYAQMENILYFIKTPDNIGYFDLTTDVFTPSAFRIPRSVFRDACIGAHSLFLAVVGGYNYGYLKQLYLYDLSGGTWTQPANLKYGRKIHSCVVHQDSGKFYVFGGISQNNYSPLNVEIYHNSNPSVFTQLANNLLNPVWRTRAVVYQDVIYVVGGFNANSREDAIRTQIIDTVFETVQYGPFLAYGTQYAPVIEINHVLYCFGGYTIDNWQYYDLLSTSVASPTNIPSSLPTNIPSSLPTNIPSSLPTNIPSSLPTNIPSSFVEPYVVLTQIILDGNFTELVHWLNEQNITVAQKSLRLIETLIGTSAPPKVIIAIIDVFDGSIVIEYTISSLTENALREVIRNINSHINTTVSMGIFDYNMISSSIIEVINGTFSIPTQNPTHLPSVSPSKISTKNPSITPIDDNSSSSEDDSSSSSEDAAAGLFEENKQLGDNVVGSNNDGATSIISLHFSTETLINIWILFGVLMIVNLIFCFMCNGKKKRCC